MELLVLSDDFTGALDTGVQFAKQGVRTEVTSKLDLTKNDLDFERTTVLVINTETRHLKPREAHGKVKKVTRDFVSLIEKHWGVWDANGRFKSLIVPALSGGALIGLGAVLMALGVSRLRRRRGGSESVD